MVWAKLSLADRQGALPGRMRGRQLAEVVEYGPDVVEAACHLGMVGAKLGLADSQSALMGIASGR